MSEEKNISLSRLVNTINSISAYSVPDIDCSVKLDGNESPFDLLKEFREEVESEIKKIRLNRYPDPSCSVLLRKIQDEIGFPSEGIVLGNGSDELIQILITTFTGKTGVVLVPRPTFSMYKISSLTLGKNVQEVDLDESFDLDTDKLKESIKMKDPDLFFFASPNNPTGNLFTKSKIIEVLESTDGIVVVDEAYFDYTEETLIPLVNMYQNLVVLRTLSKIGFASLRLGYLVTNPAIAYELNKVRLPYNINTISQKIAEIFFDHYSQFVVNFETIKNEREVLFGKLSKIRGLVIYPSDANFFLVRVNDADEVFSKLVEKSILVRNLNMDGRLENCLRITIGSPEENHILVKNLSEILSS